MATISDLDPTEPTSDGLAGQGDDFLRLIQDALKTCWGGIDGAVNSGTGNPLATAADMIGLFDEIAALKAQIGAGEGTGFVGEIKPWYGTYEDVPTGWYICDGGNGTPDLRGRTLLGANSTTGSPTFDGLTQGGSASGEANTGLGGGHAHFTYAKALTMANLPSDLGNNIGAVVATGDSGIAHQNENNVAGGQGTGFSRPAAISVTGAADEPHFHGDTSYVQHHTHPLSPDGYPPFNAMYFIMYTGA